jgi:UDP-N-acetylmuramoyl-tripeptide--D-alanyl-D-alanine ligase
MILGDMLELGETSEKHHRDAGRRAAKFRPDVLICVGQRAKWIAEQAGRDGMPADAIRCFADSKTAAAEVPATLRSGDLVLVKASRGIRLEEIIKAMSMKSAA